LQPPKVQLALASQCNLQVHCTTQSQLMKSKRLQIKYQLKKVLSTQPTINCSLFLKIT